ncbi:MAG: anti-CBASS protein Acb1 family protein, partial [Waterburya sp.]
MGNIINPKTRVGTEDDSSQYSIPGYKRQLSEVELETLACHLLLTRICTAYPDSAIIKGWEINFGVETKPEAKIQFATEDRNLKVANCFNEAEYLAAVYGGAVIVMYVDDGRPSDQPIDRSKIKAIEKLRVLDSGEIHPLILGNENPADVEHYQLFYWQKKQDNFLIHRDRVIRFDGTRVPPRVMRNRGGWSPSLLELLWDDYNDYVSGLAATNSLIKDFNIYYHKIKGLLDLIRSAENEQETINLLTERCRLLRQSLNNYGGAMIDFENEEIGYQTRSFAGIDQITNGLREHFIGVSGLPH